VDASAKQYLLDNQLCFAIYSASLTMNKAYKPHLDAVGLTYPQYLVMLVLWESDNLTVSEIGDRLFLDSGTLTPLLKRLEVCGHIKRQRDKEDERRVRVVLTTSGKQLKRKIQSIPQTLFEATKCSRKEATALTQTLQSLRENLESSRGYPNPGSD
jgi:DNA-binding MarR family transcriptional regulator